MTPVGAASPIRLVAYHALHGGHGTIKPATSQALALWLAKQKGPVLLGMDANSPDVDHPDESEIECCWAQPRTRAMERALLGPTAERAHTLTHFWRTYLTHHEQEFRQLRASAPTGPLATTHYTGSGTTRRPRRYDSIWGSTEFTVLDVRHMQAGFDAGSDRALVVTRLDL